MTRRTHTVCLTVMAGASLLLASGCAHHRKTARGPKAPAQQHGSGHKKANSRPPMPVYLGYTEQGVASWYGVPYHGRPAADGEIYNMETLVAAHRLLPFNTWLRVTNLKNQKTVDVRVIDRGPFVENRIIDLSKAAARQIDLLGPGIGPVRLEVIAAPPDIPSNDLYAVQVGAFSIYVNAERARNEYAARYGAAQISVRQGNSALYRVLVGRERTMQAAQKLADDFRTQGHSAFVVRLDETVTGPPASAAVMNR